MMPGAEIKWRQLAIVLLTLLTSSLSLFGVLMLARSFGLSPDQLHNPETVFSPGVVLTVLAILIVPMFIVVSVQRYIHRGTLADLGFGKRLMVPFILGSGIGLLIKLGALGVAYVSSAGADVSLAVSGVSPWSWLPYFAWYLITLFLNSLNEELVYRAYAIQNTKGMCGLSTNAIVVLAAIVFSLIHFLFESPDVPHFVYRLAFGILVGLVFVRWKNIWIIIGLHTGWNFVADSFSDSDWRMGGLLRVIGLRGGSEVLANVIVLTICVAALFSYQRCRSGLGGTSG